jgi:hypothetical protein
MKTIKHGQKPADKGKQDEIAQPMDRDDGNRFSALRVSSHAPG